MGFDHIQKSRPSNINNDLDLTCQGYTWKFILAAEEALHLHQPDMSIQSIGNIHLFFSRGVKAAYL